MPGYAVRGPDEGSGLMAWSDAERRLADSHDYWLATVRPDSRPHVMPVWAVWLDGCLWFSSSRESRKARNLAMNPHCVLTTDDPRYPVVLDGRAHLVSEASLLRRGLDAENTKYGTSYGEEATDPANSWFRVVPDRVFAL